MATTNKIVIVTPSSISDRYNDISNSDLFDQDNNFVLFCHPEDYRADPFLTTEQHPGVQQVYTTVDGSLYKFQINTERKKGRESIEYILRELFLGGKTAIIRDYHKMTARTIAQMQINQDRGYALRECQLTSLESIGGTCSSADYGLLGLGFRMLFTQINYE